MLKWSYHFEILWAIWQQYCKDICKISKGSDNYKINLRAKVVYGNRAPPQYKDSLSIYGDFHYSLIFIMGISILIRRHRYMKTGPWWQKILSKNAPVFWTPNYFSHKRGSKVKQEWAIFIWYLNDIVLQITNHKSISRHNTALYRQQLL